MKYFITEHNYVKKISKNPFDWFFTCRLYIYVESDPGPTFKHQQSINNLINELKKNVKGSFIAYSYIYNRGIDVKFSRKSDALLFKLKYVTLSEKTKSVEIYDWVSNYILKR